MASGHLATQHQISESTKHNGIKVFVKFHLIFIYRIQYLFQRAIIEFDPLCNDWQTCPSGITQWPNLTMPMCTLCNSYSARQFQSALHYITPCLIYYIRLLHCTENCIALKNCIRNKTFLFVVRIS